MDDEISTVRSIGLGSWGLKIIVVHHLEAANRKRVFATFTRELTSKTLDDIENG